MPARLGESIGENLARFRKARDLSQEQLAEQSDVGVDTIARLEQGKRGNTRPLTLTKLALPLGVSVEDLIGRRFDDQAPDTQLTPLRQAISSDGHLIGLDDFAEAVETVSIAQLAHDVHRAWHAYVAGRHTELLNTLPALLVDGRRLVHAGTDDDKATANRMLSITYRLGAGTSSRLGFTDLALLSSDRAIAAARSSDTPELQVAISVRYLVWTLVRQSRGEEAERLATTTAERIQPLMLDRDPERAGIFGNLLFNAAAQPFWPGDPPEPMTSWPKPRPPPSGRTLILPTRLPSSVRG